MTLNFLVGEIRQTFVCCSRGCSSIEQLLVDVLHTHSTTPLQVQSDALFRGSASSAPRTRFALAVFSSRGLPGRKRRSAYIYPHFTTPSRLSRCCSMRLCVLFLSRNRATSNTSLSTTAQREHCFEVPFPILSSQGGILIVFHVVFLQVKVRPLERRSSW